jgi:hypothetical protein
MNIISGGEITMNTTLGKIIAVAGNLIAILFPPYVLWGAHHWGFLFSDVVSVMGHGISVASRIDWVVLVLELAAINGVAVALMLAGRKK